MQLIKEIEIAYFRSFYKISLTRCKDLNIIFGKNDSGKSNIVRALNLFFNNQTEYGFPFDFETDFSRKRKLQTDESEYMRKFIYVKITFNTPTSYHPSLGEEFYVKRQWTVSRGPEYVEEYSQHIASNQQHILSRFLNKIRFIYIPAIKDNSIFERLLFEIYSTISESEKFNETVKEFTEQIQDLTQGLFESLPADISASTKIGAPTQLAQLFQTLDFETAIDQTGEDTMSLTRQRGDGVKARHIPELLKFISQQDRFNYHIWGFEEPENSLDFLAAQSEADRMLKISEESDIQTFMTTHSPAFYLLDEEETQKYYVEKKVDFSSEIIQGKKLENFDIDMATNSGFLLPAVAEKLSEIKHLQSSIFEAERNASEFKRQLEEVQRPVILTEGRTDAHILNVAWQKLYGEDCPYVFRSCETAPGAANNAGADKLAACLKTILDDHPRVVIGLFDFDEKGIRASKLDNNFITENINDIDVRKSAYANVYAFNLIPPEFRTECAEHENLPIEFMFDDRTLSEAEASGAIELHRMASSIKIGPKTIKNELSDVTHFKSVGAGKVNFAENFVPNLPEDRFIGFEDTFAMIDAIVNREQ